MKKAIFVYLLLVLGSITAFGQKSDKVKYSGGEIYRVTKDSSSGRETSRVPYGKVMAIEYDTFFKKITCLFKVSEGVTGFTLEYVRDAENSSSGMMIMYDRKSGEKYYVINNLNCNGTMLMTLTRELEGEMVSFYFTGVKRD